MIKSFTETSDKFEWCNGLTICPTATNEYELESAIERVYSNDSDHSDLTSIGPGETYTRSPIPPSPTHSLDSCLCEFVQGYIWDLETFERTIIMYHQSNAKYLHQLESEKTPRRALLARKLAYRQNLIKILNDAQIELTKARRRPRGTTERIEGYAQATVRRFQLVMLSIRDENGFRPAVEDTN